MITDLTAAESIGGYTIRVWTGVATDEGVGLIAMVEVTDARGVPVCRFDEFVADSVRRESMKWPREQGSALEALQAAALARGRDAVLGGALQVVNGHRYDAQA